ncbi:MAG: GH25 family lysozyme [Prevotella sp.]|nr:GH25 family lysozyme [Prevotella sp.]
MRRLTVLLLSIFLGLGVYAQNDIIQCEDTCAHIHGLDMSHYQGDVFWETVGNNSKMMYVYLKATEGSSRIDPKYERNIKLAQQYGLKVGSYHFYRALVPQEEQLRNFTAQCLPKDQDLIPMIDVEVVPKGMSTQDFCDSLLVFIDLVEKTYRQKPLIYTYTNFYNRHLAGKIDRYPLMIAQYTKNEPVLADGRDIVMWQYTGKGRINGVNTYVDKSRFMGKHGMREIRFRHH